MRKKGSFAAYLYSSHDYEQNEEKMAAMGLDTEGLLTQTGDWVTDSSNKKPPCHPHHKLRGRMQKEENIIPLTAIM